MKKHLSIIAIIIVSGLLFSCKNSLELVKRHYGKGYYIAVNNAPTQKAVKQPKTEKTVNEEMEKVLISMVKENLAKEIVKEISVVTASSKKEPVVAINKTSNKYPSNIITVQHSNNKPIIKQNSKTKAQSKPVKGDGAATNPIVLIIVSIFIPPLAVYLKEDRIGTSFWIDLILWFLFLLPGIVFALLVCFDVVKLD